eukprot:CAMPEP_0181202920 /NCGR_PEP_ID=MMETSP1096-20121128/19107_1 /TAXON_ID=156174 ORGANISM="Chrysochromulina ericina, Strain CCMP281" /NCGR_SAMPLE_ID=MMETSP1096 /ASSEMBLY_ACC=CAM_ASM_000453 /LENGTH=77 /DNA_ID=CAMNT_0023293481 /DNA_START=655 /DNA_END=889 /DNA_ORIENTATION=-
MLRCQATNARRRCAMPPGCQMHSPAARAAPFDRKQQLLPSAEQVDQQMGDGRVNLFAERRAKALRKLDLRWHVIVHE